MKGFTLVEFLVTLAVLSLITVASLPILYSFRVGNLTKDTADMAVMQLRIAQTRTVTGNANDVYGVRFEASKFVLFKSAVYNVADTENYAVDLPGELEFYDISLNGGGGNVVFSRPKGNTAYYGSIKVRLKGSTAEYWLITVNQAGLADASLVKL